MIYIILIIAATSLLAFAFGFLGNLPATPEWLTTSSDLLVDFISFPIHIMTSLLNDHLFFGGLALVASVFAWEPIYHSIMWVLKKIPMLGIK